MHIIPMGGRVKSAGVGLDCLYGCSIPALNRRIASMRKDPPEALRNAFFPRMGRELRHMLDGIGLYRPMLKTDQGMPGNFLEFRIDPGLNVSTLSRTTILFEEGAIFAEEWGGLRNGALHHIRDAFRKLDLETTIGDIARLGRREANKGRLPLFFVRPAQAEKPIVFGRDVVKNVEAAVATQLQICIEEAMDRELRETGSVRSHNMLYVQPDVYIERHGAVTIEAIRCPDVGFFLTQLHDEADGSRILPGLVGLMKDMRTKVCQHIINRMGTAITILTRDEVLNNHEDMLEIREIESLTEGLQALGAAINVASLGSVGTLAAGTSLLLLNLDYRAAGAQELRTRHARGDLICYPNPFVQEACQEMAGLSSFTIDPGNRLRKPFLDLARSTPSSDAGLNDVIRRLDDNLNRCQLHGDILHMKLASEVVPVFRTSMHSWRQFAMRAARPENDAKPIVMMSVPVKPERLLLTSSTGPRLHVFRFMAVV